MDITEMPAGETTTAPEGVRPKATTGAVLVGVGASSAAVLILEVVLTRLFAVAQFYHFAFLAVSLALLGFGASGSALHAFPRLGRGGPRRWSSLAALQAVTTVGAYLAVNAIPFDSFSIAWDRRQILYLVGYYLVLAVPFFFGGAVIGTLLTGWDQPVPVPSRRVYAASLVGSGVGALVALGTVGRLGGEGVVMLAALVATVGAASFEVAAPRVFGRRVAMVTWAVLLAALTAAPPGFLDVRLSPYKGLSGALRYPGAEIVSTRWNAWSRVDHVRSEGIRSLPGLSFTYPGLPPPQDGVTFDGDDLSAIPTVAAADADFVPFLLSSLPFALRQGGEALVLEPRGGLDLLVALVEGAASVVAVEPNELVVRAAREAAASAYDDPRVEVVTEEPRTYVERTGRRFDVIDLALTAPYRPVSSGAYSLAEEYELTVEAFVRYLQRLRPGGILAAMRWVQTPPSEEVRLLGIAAEAVRRAGAEGEGAVVALRGYATALVLVAPDGFAAGDLSAIRRFADDRRFDLVAAPGLEAGESNRFNVLPDDDYHELAVLLLGNDPEPAYDAAEFDITPPTDDHPFFGHFFRWEQSGAVLDTLGRTWQPFGGAGFFVLVALLALSAGGAALLILLPLLVAPRRRGVERGPTWWTLGYFGLLGIGFLFVEIPLIQIYILVMGHPTTALAVVLFALLVASGAGSMMSHRVPWRGAAIAVAAAAVVYPFLLRAVIDAVLPLPLRARLVVGALAIAPLGFAMGIMFPKGLAHLERRAPHLVPWAWGVNGTMSVVSSAASALAALTFGFTAVLLVGAACYGVAALLSRREEATPEDRATAQPVTATRRTASGG